MMMYDFHMKRLLVQTQLSNYTPAGRFVLEADSGWQMCVGRIREMLKLNPELHVDIMGPDMNEGREQCVTHPVDVNPDLWNKYGDDGEQRLRYIGHRILPNALVTRYDFDWTGIAIALDIGMQKIGHVPKYDAVYINDPLHLTNFKALFHVVGGYQPKFFVHSHFVDVPSVPKFPKEASLWLGQCEAAIKADYNFWQCETAMNQFFNEMSYTFTEGLVDRVVENSAPWDDGYSNEEISSPINMDNVRFTSDEFAAKTKDKVVLFFPNRISPSSGDYTNGMKFMFDLLPQLRKRRQDFVVICGNPNLKFTNDELVEKCSHDGYIKLVPDTLNRDEYKLVARSSDIALGLYNADAYGGTAARECVELGCIPMWLDNYEYSSLAREASADHVVLAKADFSDFIDKLDVLTTVVKNDHMKRTLNTDIRKVTRSRCSYEATTPIAMKNMGLL